MRGDYHDALFNRNSRVVAAIVETSGGIAPGFLAHIGALTRARGSGAVDRTRYGKARLSPRSYFVHHTQQISLAAILGDAEGVLRQVDYMKQQEIGRASDGDGASAAQA